MQAEEGLKIAQVNCTSVVRVTAKTNCETNRSERNNFQNRKIENNISSF